MQRILEIHDIECLSNLFTYTGYVPSEDKYYQFVIHSLKNDYEELINHLLRGIYLVGFNSENYDYPVLHHLINHYNEYKYLHPNELAQRVYFKSNQLLNNDFNIVADKNKHIPNLDLFKIWHMDNPGRRCSLKMLEASMRMENIEEMPFNHDHWFNDWEEIEKVLGYNKWDVTATYKFFLVTIGQTDHPLYKGKDKLQLRKDIQRKYGLRCLNMPDVKIGEELLLKLYCEAAGLSTYEVRQWRTERSFIHLGECIPNYVQFKTKPFQAVHEWISQKTIFSTAGGLSNIPIEECEILLPYIYPGSARVKTKRGQRPKKILENLNIRLQDKRLDFGTGGIHASLTGKFEADDKYLILDIDVAGMYPALEVENNMYQKHLGPLFTRVLKENIVDVRSAEKLKPKDERDFVIIEGLKLAGNGAYGKSGEPTSFLYDTLFTMKTTIGGQLSVSMLIESILLACKSVLFLQCNTDGITIKLERAELDKCLEICKEWEQITKLVLEYNYYKLIVIVDVSTYIAVYENGEIKHKADFEIDKELYKNPSMRIVPIALEKYFVHNIPIEETIYNHTDIYDFCLVTRCDNRFELLYRSWDRNHRTIEQILPKTQRYYASLDGGYIFKRAVDKDSDYFVGINAGQIVTLFNKYVEKNFKDYNIDYNFYIKECKKIINKIEPSNVQLTLF